MNVNLPSIAQLMSFQTPMSSQQMSTQPNSMSAQQMSTQLFNLYLNIKCTLDTPLDSKESSTFSYGNIPE